MKHNKKEWNRFIELKKLIDQNPTDKKLLKQELKDNYYQNNLKTIADVRRHLAIDFLDRFFSRETMKFFGTREVKFSKKDLIVYCYNRENIATYYLDWDDSKNSLTLKHL